MANQQFDERDLLANSAYWNTGSGLGPIQIVNGYGAGTRVDAIFAANYDSIDHNVIFGNWDTTLLYPFATVTLPAAVGGVPSITEVVAAAFPAGGAPIFPGGSQLWAAITEAVTDDSTPVTVQIFGGNL